MSYYKENAWWGSPFNDIAEVREKSLPKQRPILHDITLRDGDQTPGIVFSKDDKIRIAEKLIEFGIASLEPGLLSSSKEDREVAAYISSHYPHVRMTAGVVPGRHSEDIKIAADCGLTWVGTDFPIGIPAMRWQYDDPTYEESLKRHIECICEAHDKGLKVVVGQKDTGRAEPEKLYWFDKELMRAAKPERFCIIDSTGGALPAAVGYMTTLIKEATGGSVVEVHCHNDFGLAVACELAGAVAGAEILHSSVNGLGDRTGNAPMEDLLLCLNVLMGQELAHDMKRLQEICELVSELTGIPIPRNKTFSGSHNYMREFGSGLDHVYDNPLALFATDPRYFGKKADVVLGKKSSKASIAFFLNKLDLTAPEDALDDILAEVKALSDRKRGLLNDDEFRKIVAGYR